MRTRPVLTELLFFCGRSVRRTEISDEAISCFSQFCEKRQTLGHAQVPVLLYPQHSCRMHPNSKPVAAVKLYSIFLYSSTCFNKGLSIGCPTTSQHVFAQDCVIVFNCGIIFYSKNCSSSFETEASYTNNSFQFNLLKPTGYVMHQQFNLLKPAGYVMHQQFNIQQLYVLPTLYLCVLYLSENKQWLVLLTA